MGYAKPQLRPLNEIAIIDEATIQSIAALIPPPDLSNYVQKEFDKSLVANSAISNIHASGSDNQDLSGLQPKETGKGLSTNDYTDAEEEKLAGIEAGANNYSHPSNHSPSIITQDVNNRFVTDTEKSTWNGKEPGNSNIQTHVTSAHLQFSGLTKITVSPTSPSNPQEGDLWIDTSE